MNIDDYIKKNGYNYISIGKRSVLGDIFIIGIFILFITLIFTFGSMGVCQEPSNNSWDGYDNPEMCTDDEISFYNNFRKYGWLTLLILFVFEVLLFLIIMAIPRTKIRINDELRKEYLDEYEKHIAIKNELLNEENEFKQRMKKAKRR